jgi:hypothetical protein
MRAAVRPQCPSRAGIGRIAAFAQDIGSDDIARNVYEKELFAWMK